MLAYRFLRQLLKNEIKSILNKNELTKYFGFLSQRIGKQLR